MTTTEGKLYFIELSTKERLEIQFVPEVLRTSRRPFIVGIMPVGRNNVRYAYTGGETELRFRLDFFADQEDREDVYSKVAWLESLTYNEGSNLPPSKVQLVWGSKMFRRHIWVVKSVDSDLSLFHKVENYLPQQAYVDIVLGLDPDKDLVKNQIRTPFYNVSAD